jgi:large subunit ribosomal protein L23
MKIEPIVTEKTTSLADEGKYTFRVGRGLNKFQIKELVEKTFGVHVTNVRTINEAGETKRTIMGRKKIVQPGKKAIVTLKEKEKIGLFESK